MEERNAPAGRLGGVRRRAVLVGLVLFVLAAGTTTFLLISGSDPSRRGPGGTAAISPDAFIIEPGGPIPLGTLLVTAGKNASLGIDSQQGAVLAAQLRGPVLGHRVRFVHANDGCSKHQGEAGARQLVEEGVIAVIGPSCSSAADGALPILSGARVLTVSPSATGPHLTDPPTPYFARTAFNDVLEGEIAARFARSKEIFAETAAIVTEDTPYTTALTAEFGETFVEHGGTVVARAKVSDETRMDEIAREIAAHRPDMIYAPLFLREGALFTRAARRLLPQSELMLASSVFSPDWIEAAGPENAEGAYVTGPDLAVFEDPDFYENEFLPAYKKAFGEEPQSVFHTHAFDAVNMILDALERVAIRRSDGTLAIEPRALLDDFFSIRDYRGVSGKFSCTPTGDCLPEQTMCVHEVGAYHGFPWCEAVRLD